MLTPLELLNKELNLLQTIAGSRSHEDKQQAKLLVKEYKEVISKLSTSSEEVVVKDVPKSNKRKNSTSD